MFFNSHMNCKDRGEGGETLAQAGQRSHESLTTGSAQGQVGWGSEQLGQVKTVP